MKSVALSGNKRAERGTSNANILRKEEKVPAVIYGGKENVHFTVNEVKFNKIINTPEVYFIDLDVDGTKFKAIIKDVQFHPVTDEIMHIDFVELVANKKVKVEVPVRITGSAPGVKVGGKLQQSIRSVKIETTPETLIDHVTVDVSDLQLGSVVRIRDIQVIEGVSVLNPPAIPIAGVEIPRVLRSAMTEDAKAGGATEEEAEA